MYRFLYSIELPDCALSTTFKYVNEMELNRVQFNTKRAYFSTALYKQ